MKSFQRGKQIAYKGIRKVDKRLFFKTTGSRKHSSFIFKMLRKTKIMSFEFYAQTNYHSRKLQNKDE